MFALQCQLNKPWNPECTFKISHGCQNNERNNVSNRLTQCCTRKLFNIISQCYTHISSKFQRHYCGSMTAPYVVPESAPNGQ